MNENSSYFYVCTLMLSSEWQSVALWQVAIVNRLSYGVLLCVLIKPKFKIWYETPYKNFNEIESYDMTHINLCPIKYVFLHRTR